MFFFLVSGLKKALQNIPSEGMAARRRALPSSGTLLQYLPKAGLALLPGLMLPALALAHSGQHGHGFDFLSGLGHPLGGLDHLLAMLAVGLWAGQMGGRAVWLVPAAFVAVMVAGGLLALTPLQLPAVEPGILASVVVIGLAVALAVRPPLWAGSLLVGFFALFHGFAHGAEMPAGGGMLGYAAGFVLASVLLHAGGVLVGLAARRFHRELWCRLAGGGIALAGVGLGIAAVA